MGPRRSPHGLRFNVQLKPAGCTSQRGARAIPARALPAEIERTDRYRRVAVIYVLRLAKEIAAVRHCSASTARGLAISAR